MSAYRTFSITISAKAYENLAKQAQDAGKEVSDAVLDAVDLIYMTTLQERQALRNRHEIEPDKNEATI